MGAAWERHAVCESACIAPLHHGTSHAQPWLAEAPAALPPRKDPQCPYGKRHGGPLSTSGRSAVFYSRTSRCA